MRKLIKSLLVVPLLVYSLMACQGQESESNIPAIADVQQSEILITVTPTRENEKSEIRLIDQMTLVFIPGGVFQMGSTDAQIDDAIELCNQHYQICNRWYYERESPLHQVSIDSFYIDQTEVSNAQYQLCIDAGICLEPVICKRGEPTIGDPEKSDHPVVCVNWDDAQTYCQWVGARLPTEAEWEYASRGEECAIYPWGDEFDGSLLNYCDNNCSQNFADDRYDDGYVQTAPVGTFPLGASWAGVLNMGGNVSEWVQDWMGEYQSGPVSNPVGPSEGNQRMLKGCSWFGHPTYCRGAIRPSVNQDTRFENLGFRCAASIDE